MALAMNTGADIGADIGTDIDTDMDIDSFEPDLSLPDAFDIELDSYDGIGIDYSCADVPSVDIDYSLF